MIKKISGDGFTPLHLVASRSEAHDGSNGPLIRLDEDTQVRFFKVVHTTIFSMENSFFFLLNMYYIFFFTNT